ncbi:MAG: hypothetical protein ACREIF_16710 [Chthoniobacterales bacterium]
MGGLLTGLFTYVGERHRSRSEAKRQSRQRQENARQAARVVDAELEQAEISANSAVQRKEWWPEEIGPIEVGSWNQYRAVLANELSLDYWRVVARAFQFIHGINSACAIASRPDLLRNATFERVSRVPMSEDDQKRIPFGIAQIAKARKCLLHLLPADNFQK